MNKRIKQRWDLVGEVLFSQEVPFLKLRIIIMWFLERSSNSVKQGFSANIDVKQNEKMYSRNSSPGFTSEQMKKLLSLINETPTASIHANMASKASFFNGWIIDSGANQHLTVSTVGMFNIVDIFELKIIMGHLNVPGYCVCLIFVNKLIRDSKMFVGFDENNNVYNSRQEKVRKSWGIGRSFNDDRKDTSVEDGSMQPSFDIADYVHGMSTRQFKLPVKLNDYVLSSNVKYGIEKYVNYCKLKGDNLCFDTTLNKSIEPTCLSDALFDPNWIEAINNKIEAFNRNNTWTECGLPHGRF
ncbi:hypothetical protein Tco_0079553 [Tanacetum coccineum]